MVVFEDDCDVDFELDLEEVGDEGGTREKPGENHEERNRKFPADVAFAHLDVLNLRRFSREPFGAAHGLHPNQLQFDRFNRGGAVMDDDLAGERTANGTIPRI